MKNVFFLLFICCFATATFGQEDKDKKTSNEKERKIILHVNTQDLALQAPEAQLQEQVDVQADEFPGLNVNFDNPAISMQSYKPYTKRELQAYSDLLLDYKLTDFDRTETARPHKSGRIFQVSVPD